MRVAMIGAGYVGLVSGACFSEFGHNVTCVDKDLKKIEALKKGVMPIYEPGLAELVARNVSAGRLSFTTEIDDAVSNADAVFIAVGTPSRRGDGHADLSFVFAACEEVASHIRGYTVIVTKSTVPVGTGAQIEARMRASRPDGEFDVASNPEFLREGAAIGDFMRPDRVVVGAESERARNVMRELYRPLFLRETPVLFTERVTAELIKYAANAFLATKISFINEIADLCEKLGGNVQEVAKGIGLDGRIGAKFLHAGPGYGGSCFPKDTVALARTAEEQDVPLRIVNTVIGVNNARKRALAKRVVNACDGVEGKTIAVLGLTFKPDTDDMRESPSIDLIEGLQRHGAAIRAYDPEGIEEAKKIFDDVHFAKDAYDAMSGADAVVLVTEWNQFRALDLPRVKSLLKQPVFIDLRNIYRPKDMAAAGFTYISIGRPNSL